MDANNRKRSRAQSRESTRKRVRVHRAVSKNLINQDRVIENRVNNVSSNSNSESENEEQVFSGRKRIQLWALQHNITQNALSDLLKILISFGLTWLPADARTLVQTPRNIDLIDSANGKLWYCGIESNLRKIFGSLSEDLQLNLNINADGVPPHKSAKPEFWPILANIHSKQIFSNLCLVMFCIMFHLLNRFSFSEAIHCFHLVW